MENIVGQRIKELRKKYKMSVDDLAEKVGKSRATIYRYENGEIENAPYTVLIPFAKALNTTPTYLMGIDDEPNIKQSKTLNEQISERIKEIRENHNITLEEFANEFHITVEDLKQYESGEKKIPFSLIKAVGDYFGITTYQQTGLTIPAPVDNDFGISMNVLKATDRWNKEVGVVQFSDDELTELINFANYLISKRKE